MPRASQARPTHAGCRLPVGSGVVDAFISIAAFEHAPRPEFAFEEIDLSLVLGGRALISPALGNIPIEVCGSGGAT